MQHHDAAGPGEGPGQGEDGEGSPPAHDRDRETDESRAPGALRARLEGGVGRRTGMRTGTRAFRTANQGLRRAVDPQPSQIRSGSADNSFNEAHRMRYFVLMHRTWDRRSYER